MVGIDIEGNNVLFLEERGGRRGTDYYYVELNDKLHPVRELGIERFLDKSGGAERYEVKVKLKDVEGKRIFHFGFTNSGFFVPRLLKIKNGIICHDSSHLTSAIGGLSFSKLGDEGSLSEDFREILKEINRMKNKKSMNLDILFVGHAEATTEAIRDPDTAYITSMVFPSSRSRKRSLESKLRNLHEIWILMHLIDALGGSGVELHIETASEYPTCHLKTLYGTLTIWYQFPILDQFTAIVTGARSKERVHVRPDIVVFKGYFKDAEELRAGDKIREKAVVIDPKIKMSNEDVEQLEAYTKLFSGGSKFICSCIGKTELRPNGWDIIEYVKPKSEGLEKFKVVVKNSVINL